MTKKDKLNISSNKETARFKKSVKPIERNGTWFSDLIAMNDYRAANKSAYRFILVLIDNFSKYGSTGPLKKKNAQTMTDQFPILIRTSKRKPNLIETDDGKE